MVFLLNILDQGLAGHSSAPHKGVSAVEFAARYASKLIELRNELKKRAPKDSIFDPPFSTLQVGGIFGGIAHNVIADKCHINWGKCTSHHNFVISSS